MIDFGNLLPEHLRHLGEHATSDPLYLMEADAPYLKMALNENPYCPSPRVLEAIKKAAAGCNFYPDNFQRQLRERLAQETGLQSSEVLITAGSAAFLSIAAQTLLSPGTNAVTSAKSYMMYRSVTQAAGATLIQVPMRDTTFDLDGIRQALNGETRLIFIANPNNPTGTIVGPAEMERFLDRLPEKVIVVIDEAYSDFASWFAKERGVDYSRSLDYVRQGRNVLVLRTFSKAHSLAGLRIGYGLAPAEFIQYFARIRMPYSVSNIAAAGALAALDDTEYIHNVLDNNCVAAVWLIKEIQKIGIEVTQTWTNFLYLQLAEEACSFSSRLQQAGVLIRPLTHWGAPSAIRVTIGTPDQNERFLMALYRTCNSDNHGLFKGD